MLVSELNYAVAGLQNVDTVTLHTADPGNTGENDSGETGQALTWSDPLRGWIKAVATFPDVPAGTYTHVGLWDGAVFIHSEPFNVTLPDVQDLKVMVEFGAEVKP